MAIRLGADVHVVENVAVYNFTDKMEVREGIWI